jgi:cobalamin biosynthesis protein CbiD
LEIGTKADNLEKLLHAKIGTVTGLIDDTNLDSIREIADRIKDDAKETQSLRSEMLAADLALSKKIDALIPADLQNKTVQEWAQIIEAIVEEEVTALNVVP